LSGKLEESLGVMAKLHRIYPYAPEPFFELAEIAQKQGRFANAAPYFEQGLEIQPQSSWGWYCLAESRRNLGDTDAALDAVHRSLDLLPTMIQARILRAGLLAQMAKYEDALAAFRVIHDDHPDRADLLLNMADIHRYKGDCTKALMVAGEFAGRYGESEQLVIALAKIKDVMETSASHSV
jgi:tetratricopeptide (TPR) repeat protein